MKPQPLSYVAAFLLLFAVDPRLRAAEPVPVADEKITLPKFEVKGTAICSYGIGVTVIRNKDSQKIVHLYITDVAAGSTADSLGLQVGDEILTLNGRKVTELKPGMKHGSELFDLLVDQPPGRRIDIEVATRVVKKVVLTAIP